MNSKKKNFGYGRRMDFAGKQLLREKYDNGHFGTVAAHAQRFSKFADYLSKNFEVKDMRNINAEHVKQYADFLKSENSSIAYAQNCLSSINTVMEYADRTWVTQSPSDLLNASRDNVRHDAPEPLDRNKHNAAVNEMRNNGMQRAAAIADLSREFGLRSREAVLADLNRWKKEAETQGRINIQDGTKGGRNAPRHVVVDTDEKKQALENAMKVRPDGSKNLLDRQETYTQAVNTWINEGRNVYREYSGGTYHDARSAYACERYKELTKHEPPCVTGSRTAPGDIDNKAREIISHELGHNRIDVLVSYIGGRK